MEVDKKIMAATQQVFAVLNEAGLTLGIMELILKDILHTVQAQQQAQFIAEARAAEEPEEQRKEDKES